MTKRLWNTLFPRLNAKTFILFPLSNRILFWLSKFYRFSKEQRQLQKSASYLYVRCFSILTPYYISLPALSAPYFFSRWELNLLDISILIDLWHKIRDLSIFKVKKIMKTSIFTHSVCRISVIFTTMSSSCFLWRLYTHNIEVPQF